MPVGLIGRSGPPPKKRGTAATSPEYGRSLSWSIRCDRPPLAGRKRSTHTMILYNNLWLTIPSLIVPTTTLRDHQGNPARPSTVFPQGLPLTFPPVHIHQGKRCEGKTPMQTFLDGLELVNQKNLDTNFTRRFDTCQI